MFAIILNKVINQRNKLYTIDSQIKAYTSTSFVNTDLEE